MTLEKAKQRAFDRCNLIGENVDIYKVLYSYKAIRELPDEEIEKIYDEIAEDLGFSW
jgi:hypothetical protein